MTQYWVIRAGARSGPYTDADVLDGVERGTLRPNDLLWVEGLREGVPIAEVIANLGAGASPKSALELEPFVPVAPSPYRPPSARLDDITQITLGNVQYAGFWVRFAASLVDSLLILIFALAIGILIGIVAGILHTPVGNSGWANVLGFVLSWLYFASMESGIRCATFGKRVFQLQVLNADDLTRIGFLRATLRWIGRFVSAFLLMIGYLMQPFTPRKRALHDFIAGTVVIVEAQYSRALVVVTILLFVGGPIIVGLMLGAGLKLLQLLGR